MNMSDMREKLIGVTIGGGAEDIDPAYRASVFGEYIQKAFPDSDVSNVEPISTAASLNSICAYVDIAPKKGDEFIPAFAKIHIESDTDSDNVLGEEDEYGQATLLDRFGWPVLKPLMVSQSADYPLLIYPRIREKTLFDLLKDSSDEGNNLITSADLDILEQLNRRVGEAMAGNSILVDSEEAVISPVQTLFLGRFKEGGRIDAWYEPETAFSLPGIDRPMKWREIVKSKWVINGSPYDNTLFEVVENARNSLSFDGESKALVCVSHGDDHPGNIFMNKKKGEAIIFDPAFAGWNPASLSNIKAFAHSILPIGGMYYDPQVEDVFYDWDKEKNVISVDIPFETSALFDAHGAIARQIADLRILPLLQKAKTMGINMKREADRIRHALVGCALLTTDVRELLEKGDRRGQGLLPLAIMFSELRGLPVLDYLEEKINSEL